MEPLALRTPVAGFNGGIFVKADMTIMAEHVLAADAAARAIEVIIHHGMDVWVYSGKDWLVRDVDAPHVAREQWTVKFAPTIVENFKDVLGKALKIVGVSDDLDLVTRCEKGAQDALGAKASGSLAALLSRHHPSGCQQRHRRHDAVEARRYRRRPIGSPIPMTTKALPKAMERFILQRAGATLPRAS
jgi:hypothetical protein